MAGKDSAGLDENHSRSNTDERHRTPRRSAASREKHSVTAEVTPSAEEVAFVGVSATPTRSSRRIRSRVAQKRYRDHDYDFGDEDAEDVEIPENPISGTASGNVASNDDDEYVLKADVESELSDRSESPEPESQQRTKNVQTRRQKRAAASSVTNRKRRGRTAAVVIEKELQGDKRVPIVELHNFSEQDILMGRGNNVNKLAGNQRFRRVVHPFRKPYSGTTDSTEKRKVLLEAYHCIIKDGARFLEVVQWGPKTKGKTDEGERGVFRTVPLSRALEKVAQALREPKWTPPAPLPVQSSSHSRLEAVGSGAPSAAGESCSTTGAKESRALTVSASAPSSLPVGDTRIGQEEEPNNEEPVLEKRPSPTEDDEKQPGKSDSRPPRHQFRHILLLSSDGDSGGAELALPASVGDESGAEEPPPTLRSKKKRSGEEVEQKKVAPGANTQRKRKRASAAVGDGHALTVVDFADVSEEDVLFGRGHHVNQHVGNIRFREAIRQQKEAYAKLTLHEKRPMAMKIYEQFAGRFLELDPSNSTPQHKKRRSALPPKQQQLVFRRVEMERCLEKICQALREKYSYLPSSTASSDEARKPQLWSAPEEGSETLEKVPSRNQTRSSQSKVKKQARAKQVDETRAVKLPVGSLIAVYWPIDRAFYEAVVEDCKCATTPASPDVAVMLHAIRYLVDSEKEWIDLTEHKYKKVAPEGKESEEAKLASSASTTPIMRRGCAERKVARRTPLWGSSGGKADVSTDKS